MGGRQEQGDAEEAGGGSSRPAGDAALLARLVDAARAGDREAVTRIIELCAPMVRAVASRYVTSPPDVEDIVQDVWVTLAEHLDRIESPAALRGWLVRVTTHAAWRLRRRDHRARPLVGIDDRAADEDTETQVVDRIHRTAVCADVRAAIRRLRPTDRRLVILLMTNERPDYRAIARMLDCPIGSIGPTRLRAMRRLRAQGSLVRLAGPPAA